MKKTTALLLLVLSSTPLIAHSPELLQDMKRIENFYRKQIETIKREQQQYRGKALKRNDPRYQRWNQLQIKIIKYRDKLDGIVNARRDPNTIMNITSEALVATAVDLGRIINNVWNNHENIIMDAISGEYTKILSTTIDETMKLRVDKYVQEQLGRRYPQISDYFYSKFINPKVNKSQLHKYAEEAANNAKDKIKEKFTEHLGSKGKKMGAKELETYGSKWIEKVTGFIDGLNFGFEMYTKMALWNDASKPIENAVFAIKRIKRKEESLAGKRVSYIRAFNIYLGKESYSKKKEKEKGKSTVISKNDHSRTPNRNRHDFSNRGSILPAGSSCSPVQGEMKKLANKHRSGYMYYTKKYGALKVRKWVFYSNTRRRLREQNFNMCGKLEGRQLEWRQDGKLRNEKNYRNGLKHGRFISYNNRGIKVSEKNYAADKLHGKSISFDTKTGKVKSVTHFKRGQKDGAFKSYDKAGRLRNERYYKAGKLNGKTSIWKNGKLRKIKHYRNGKPEGKETTWRIDNASGRLYKYSEVIFRNGRPEKTMLYDKKGKLKGRR